MRLRGNVIGALNLFHTGSGEMQQPDIDAAQAFADIATIAVLQHRAAADAIIVNEQLNLALTSRIAIEQAKGMVAEYQTCTMEQAFVTLRNHSRNHNLRLAELAHQIIDRTLPAGRLDPIAGSATG
jgi:hypothetical protein